MKANSNPGAWTPQGCEEASPTARWLRLQAWRRAFTLVELLVVMAVILVVSGLIVPALKGRFGAYNLSGAADTVSGQLLLGRQLAISRNQAVEVRIYQYNNGGGLAWNMVGLVVPTLVSGRADEWVDPPKTLPTAIMFDPANSASGDSFSTIITAATGNTPPSASVPNPPGPWQTTESSTALLKVRGLTYVAFRYLPDGTTDLPLQDSSAAAPSWCLSLRSATAPASASAAVPASDFAAIILDPLDGRTLVYRP